MDHHLCIHLLQPCNPPSGFGQHLSVGKFWISWKMWSSPYTLRFLPMLGLPTLWMVFVVTQGSLHLQRRLTELCTGVCPGNGVWYMLATWRGVHWPKGPTCSAFLADVSMEELYSWALIFSPFLAARIRWRFLKPKTIRHKTPESASNADKTTTLLPSVPSFKALCISCTTLPPSLDTLLSNFMRYCFLPRIFSSSFFQRITVFIFFFFFFTENLLDVW